MIDRNHFCIGKGKNGYEDWEDLVSKRLAVKAIGCAEWSDAFFCLSLEGARAVLLPKENFSRKDAEKMRSLVDAGS